MANYFRRDFLKTGLAAAAFVGATQLSTPGSRQSRGLGNAGSIRCQGATRLAFGTGSLSGKVQRDLGPGPVYAAGPLRLRPRHSLL